MVAPLCWILMACGAEESTEPTATLAPAVTEPTPPAQHTAATTDGPGADAQQTPESAAAAGHQEAGGSGEANPADEATDGNDANDGAPSPATGPRALVVLSEHELLRSEQRFVDRLLARLQRSGVTLQQEEAGERAAHLGAWLDELDPAQRAAQPLSRATGRSSGLLVLRYAPPVEGRSTGVNGFGVLRGETPQEVLWAHGGAFDSDAFSGVARLMTGDQP